MTQLANQLIVVISPCRSNSRSPAPSLDAGWRVLYREVLSIMLQAGIINWRRHATAVPGQSFVLTFSLPDLSGWHLYPG